MCVSLRAPAGLCECVAPLTGGRPFLADFQMLVPGLDEQPDEKRFDKYDGMAVYEAVQKTFPQVSCGDVAPLCVRV